MMTTARHWYIAAALVGVAVLALWKGEAVASTVAKVTGVRGLRNKNPGNLRYVPSINWRGQLGDDGGGYAVFDSDLNGLRAAFLNLYSYLHTHRLGTVRKIITRWAPNHENPTDAYVAFVAKAAGVAPDAAIYWDTHAPAIVRAIVQFENGRNPYADSLYSDALRATGKA